MNCTALHLKIAVKLMFKSALLDFIVATYAQYCDLYCIKIVQHFVNKKEIFYIAQSYKYS